MDPQVAGESAITVRTVGLEQAAALAQIWVDAHRARKPGSSLDGVGVQRMVAMRMNIAGAWFEAAFEHGVPVGVVHGLPAREYDGASENIVPALMHLSFLAVTPARWGIGIGRTLLQRSLTIAAERGYRAISLWTALDNTRAIDLYTSFGFVASGREKTDERGERIIHFRREISVE